ncbi:DUF2269 domain-containing protein [Thalassotalea litorea]|uniref:DUF2269 domain-containing protein n=1 Tax=Thalassotalea litorea TaxID=2020715 RepID=A0A5R9IML0_9GAMM|nr:DUF2269 domain-containing protein [Thalassotalea litorea]TLU65693.1 DUF2269 domain-containing protein [Thalassotalea litorea]
MDYYLTLKFLHIVAAVIVAGTGTGIAFFMFMAYRSDNPIVIQITANHVIIGDWLFTTPAVITQITTGVLLMKLQGYSFSSPWFIWILTLILIIAACWLPVLRIQYRLRDLATESVIAEKTLPEFKKLMRWWIALGFPAFIAIVIIFYLMVFKPVSVI